VFIQGSTIPILASICRLPRFAVCQDRDRFTGLYHTYFRDYDPVHSRWLSEDPAGYADGLNLNAAYMDVNGVDPLGLDLDTDLTPAMLVEMLNNPNSKGGLADISDDKPLDSPLDLLKFAEGRMVLTAYLQGGARACEALGPGGDIIAEALDGVMVSNGEIYFSMPISAGEIRRPFEMESRVKRGKERAINLTNKAAEAGIGFIVSTVTAEAGAAVLRGSDLFLQIARKFRGLNLWETPSSIMETSSNYLIKGVDNVPPANYSISNCTPKSGLLPGEGQVGPYNDLIATGIKGDNLTPHHVPSANYMSQYGVSTGKGITINMEQPVPGIGGRHRMTFTYGSAADVGMAPRKALAEGVWDLRQIYQKEELYDSFIRNQLKELIQQNKNTFPDMFMKGTP